MLRKHVEIGPSSDEQLDIYLPRVWTDHLGIEDASVMTISQANDSIELFNQAINYLDSERGRMGAYENRLEHSERGFGADRKEKIWICV